MGTIVTAQPIRAGVLSTRPAATAVPKGTGYLATDEDGGTLYRTDGAAWTRVTGVAAAQRRERVWRALASPGSGVGVRRSGSDYDLLQHLGGQRWWRWRLQQITSGAYSQNYLTLQAMEAPLVSVDEADPGVTLTGSWSTGANAAAYGGVYRYSVTAGDTAVWTSPAGTTRLALRVVKAVNGGIAKVTLSGGATPDLLPTAQQLVDAGTLAATVLVANGGTLAPTDRVLDCYQGATEYDAGVALADGLSAGTYTVTITATGYKRSAATAARAYLSGFSSGTAATDTSTAGASLVKMTELMPYASAAEYAVYWKPTGGTYEWAGQVHGYDQQTSLAFWVDGAPRSLADGEVAYGDTVDVRRVSQLHHPDVGGGGTPVCDVTVWYRVTRDGVRIRWAMAWLVAGAVGRLFPAMFPMLGTVFTKGSVAAASADYALTANDDTNYGKVPSDLSYAWEDGGHWAAGMLLEGLDGVNSWAASSPDTYHYVQDRSGNPITKLYATRVYDPNTEATVNGTAMRSTTLYRMAYLTDVEVMAR